MSLYDSFFSDLNKDHVYDLIKDQIFTEKQVNISLDNEYKKIFDDNIQQIFNENNASSLNEINNIVIHNIIPLYSDKLNNRDDDNKEYDSNINSDYDNLFSERMKQNDAFKNMKTEEEERKEQEEKQIKALLEKERLDKLEKEKFEKERLETQELEKELNELEKQELEKELNDIKAQQIKIDSISYQANNIDQVEQFRPVQKIVSNKRSHIRSSRYNYSFNLKNNNISIKDNSQIQKLIIPLEDNYIFNHSIICLSIKELNLDISLELEKELDNNQRTYGVYKPIEAHRFNKPNTDSITVNITDITNTEYVNQDIINVTKLEIVKDTIIMNVNSVKDIMIEDYFKVLNLSTNIVELRYMLLEPMKVVKVDKNRLFFKTNYIMNATVVDDIEMKLMNVSNQNVLFFR
jgi:hypothetical protein